MKPGFACVVAALDGADPYAPSFKVLTEVEDTNVQSLIERAYGLYEKYGMNCRVIPWMWYGESDQGFDSFLHRFNERQRKAGIEEHFLLASPPQASLPNRFELYTHTLRSLLLQGQKRLILGENSALPAFLHNVPPAEAITGTTKDHPAVAALGYVVSALVQHRPWLLSLQDPGPRSDPYSFEHLLLKEQALTDRLLRSGFGTDMDSLIFEPCGGIE